MGQAGFWAGYDGRLVVGHNATNGVVNARVYPGVQAIGPNAGENNAFDAVAYDGWQSFDAERYDTDPVTHAKVPVGAYEIIGVFCFTAFDGTSTNCNSGLEGVTTATQAHGSNEGTAALIYYTPNGSTSLRAGLTVSAGGNGGVSVGSSSGPLPGGVPADLGNGTINAADSITTGNHFRTAGGHGSISGCGTSPTFNGGTDQAGQITVGSSVTQCTYTYAQTWTTPALCMVQVYNDATHTAYMSAQTATSFTVKFTSAYTGAFQYFCMGIP